MEKIVTKELSWVLLRQAVDEASESYLKGSWSEKDCRAYLHSFSINNEGIENVLLRCDNILAL